jgi:hypothetical protein
MPELGLIDAVGSFGTLLVVVAYFLTQTRQLDAAGWLFPSLNLAGSILISMSLVVNFNLASALMEGFWILISCFGLYRCLIVERSTPE